MFSVYILYSRKADKFYVGQTTDLNQRLEWHNSAFFSHSFTSNIHDWTVFMEIPCDSREEAIYIESHIKSMKSRKYYSNLKTYPDIIIKIKQNFRGSQPR